MFIGEGPLGGGGYQIPPGSGLAPMPSFFLFNEDFFLFFKDSFLVLTLLKNNSQVKLT